MLYYRLEYYLESVLSRLRIVKLTSAAFFTLLNECGFCGTNAYASVRDAGVALGPTRCVLLSVSILHVKIRLWVV